MSDEQFEKFYWPSFSALIYACIENGITPMPLFEGDYTPRLKYLATLPPGKVAAHFDKIDRRKFKEMCGDVMCFWGNVPPSLLATGTPQQVKDDVKELIDLFGDTGALIIDSTVGIPDEARPENVLALRGGGRRVWRPLRWARRLGRTPSSPHERLKLFEDAVALRKPDRVPLMPLALQYFHTRVAGVSDRGRGLRRQAELRLPAGCHCPLRLGLGARHGRPPVQVAGGAGLQADPLARRRPAGRRPVPVGRGRVPQGRRVRRLPLGPHPVHPAHPVAAPRQRLRRARRAAVAARLVDQHHVLPPGLGGTAGRAPDDGHVRGSRGDEPGRRCVHGGVRGLHGPDGRDGLPGGLHRGHEDALRHRVRRLPRPARQHHSTCTGSPTS